MNQSSTLVPEEDPDGDVQKLTASDQNVLNSHHNRTFWNHVLESLPRLKFIPLLVLFLYGQIRAGGEGSQEVWGMAMEIALVFGMICVAVAILTWNDYEKSRSQRAVSASAPEDTPTSTANKAGTQDDLWNGVLLLGLIWVLFRAPLTPSKAPIVSGTQPSIAPIQTTTNRSRAATLAYWNTTVGNLHEVRFKDQASDCPSEQVLDEILRRLRTLTDQAKVAPWDQVDRDLVSMAIRHFLIDDRLFQLKTERDEWMKQHPASTANASSSKEASAQWQSFVEAVQADAELLDKLPQGPERKFLEAALEFEQQRLDQFYEIESMQSVLQKRYPGLTFPLPEISQ